MTVALSLVAHEESATVVITVTGATTSFDVYRTDPDGTRTKVRGGPFTGPNAVITDYEPMFGSVGYDVDGLSQVHTTIDPDVPWLTHPTHPFLSAPVVVENDTDWSYEPRTFSFTVIGRRLPVYTWYPRAGRSGRVHIAFADTAERQAIHDALSDGSPLLIRYPSAYDQFTSSWLGIQSMRDVRPTVGAKYGHYELDYVEVDPPVTRLGVVEATAWFWEDVLDDEELPTWFSVRDVYPTWALMATHGPVLAEPSMGA